MSTRFELADYRREVSEIYSWVRNASGDPQDIWRSYRRKRERLFKTHQQSPLDSAQRSNFIGLDYFEYQPELRLVLPVEPVSTREVIEVKLEADGSTRMERIGQVRLQTAGGDSVLSIYWILGYGGGVFLPFRDATAGEKTYGGGRYLLDTIKGADLGRVGEQLVLDFNYAYNPSCAYNARWHCPLAPRANWLDIPIRAGERIFADAV